MRLLQYKMPLQDRCYVVTSGTIDATQVFRPDEDLPIQLTPAGYDDSIDKVSESIAQINSSDPDFRRNIKQVLLNQYPDCFLYAFEVHPAYLILFYTNGSNVVLKNVTLEFSVPRKNGKPDSKYQVCLTDGYCRTGFLNLKRPQYIACIDEQTGNIRRSLQLTQTGEKESKQFAFVDEYVDE